MQREKEALVEGRRAIALDPENRDARRGPDRSANLALIYALLGRTEPAISIVRRLLATAGPVGTLDTPSSITLAELRRRWEWDSLRSNAEFRKILEGPAPETVLSFTPPLTVEPPKKSIAVLPFDNLSADKENASFASGVRDGLLSDLARVADFKSSAARLGEKALALDELSVLTKQPTGIAYGDLQRDPCWDGLRADARFEKLLASLKPR